MFYFCLVDDGKKVYVLQHKSDFWFCGIRASVWRFGRNSFGSFDCKWSEFVHMLRYVYYHTAWAVSGFCVIRVNDGVLFLFVSGGVCTGEAFLFIRFLCRKFFGASSWTFYMF